MQRMGKVVSVLATPVVFFIISLAVLYDYGVNWDTLQHFVRGQIYYRYLTTGKKDTAEIPDICRNVDSAGSTVDAKTGKICDRKHIPRISFYEKTSLDFAWTDKMTIGHPPVTDILLAASNHLFYKDLGLVEDIQGYHLYIVFITFVMACIVAIWIYQLFGLFPSAISVIVLYTYPLLFAEQHFNPKDPAVASYFTVFLYFFWLGISKKKIFPIVISALFAGVSLGTKFNIIFSLPILSIWLVFWLMHHSKTRNLKEIVIASRNFLLSGPGIACLCIPCIAFTIFYASYPALWTNPIKNVGSVIAYYRDIGGSRCFYIPLTGKWLTECTNFHTIRLYVTTLPVITVMLSVIGFVWSLKTIGKYHFAPFLWALWFIVTLGRATLPIGSLYGGSLRQIMELIPAVALLSGYGIKHLRDAIDKRLPGYVRTCMTTSTLVTLGSILLFLPVVLAMIQLHPNENLYFNVFAGGLKGAVRHNYEVASNTYGNGYQQAIDWINRHLPNGANVYLAEGISSAVPSTAFRSDIRYKGSAPPIVGHNGEYIMELEEPGMEIEYFHNMRTLRSFVRPMHEVIVDGIVVASVWKNDQAHIRAIASLDSEQQIQSVQTMVPVHDEIILDMRMKMMVKRIDMETMSKPCDGAIDVLLAFISDDGVHFTRLQEQSYRKTGEVQKASIWIGASSRYVKLYTYKPTSCDMREISYTAYSF